MQKLWIKRFPRKLYKKYRQICVFNIRRINADKRALPDFLIVGSAKCGTSSLYTYMIQHPKIAPALIKEVHYFDRHYTNDLLWYRANFKTSVSLKKKHSITGEATPLYMFNPYALKRIHKVLPSVKLIVLLRNPVNRAISQYFMEVRKQFEKLPIEEAILKEEERINPGNKKVMSSKDYDSFDTIRFSYKKRGVYVEQIKNCFQLFDRKQVLILKSEDMFSSPENTLKEVFDFLDVDSNFIPSILKNRNQGRYDKSLIPVHVQKYLTDYFAPHNKRLYEYLNRDFGW